MSEQERGWATQLRRLLRHSTPSNTCRYRPWISHERFVCLFNATTINKLNLLVISVLVFFSGEFFASRLCLKFHYFVFCCWKSAEQLRRWCHRAKQLIQNFSLFLELGVRRWVTVKFYCQRSRKLSSQSSIMSKRTVKFRWQKNLITGGWANGLIRVWKGGTV